MNAPSRFNREALAVLVLTALLVLVLGLWTMDRMQDRDEAAAGPAASGEVIRWKLVTTWPKNLPGLGHTPEVFADMVREMSAGRLDIRVYGAGEIVPAFEVFDAVSSGVAELGHGASYYWKGKIPAAVFFTAVPFGMTAQEMNGWLHYGGGMALWEEAYAPEGIVPLAGGSTGVQMAGWFNREINSVGDLRGLRMRIPGLAGEVFSGAGGEAVRIPGGEIYTALQTGVIDAVEWVGPYNDLALGLHEIAEYYYYGTNRGRCWNSSSTKKPWPVCLRISRRSCVTPRVPPARICSTSSPRAITGPFASSSRYTG